VWSAAKDSCQQEHKNGPYTNGKNALRRRWLHAGQDASNNNSSCEYGSYTPRQGRVDKFAAMPAFLSLGKDFFSTKRTPSQANIS
jgi:hypothetical protein